MSILIVDDSLAQRKVIRHVLEGAGFAAARLAEAEDGETALRWLRAHERDVSLVLLDWIMPRQDGLEVLKQIKADPRLREVPVIMVTCQAQTDCVVEAMRAGARNYIVKPFRPETLVQKVREELKDRPAADSDRREFTALVVDDSDAMRRAVLQALEGVPEVAWTFLEAEDGAEALGHLRDGSWKVDIVFADWEMPNMDGLELLRQMKCDETLEAIPFVMITSVTSRERMVEAIREGARGFLAKPFRPEVLRDKVTELLCETALPKRGGGTAIMRRALAHMSRAVDENAAFLSQLPAGLREAIGKRGVRRTHPAGQILVRFNEVVDWLHVIEQGEVEIVLGLDDKVAEVRKAGDCFGEASLLTGDSAALIARTRTEVRTLSVDKRAFEALLEEFPYLGVYLSRLLARQSARDDATLTAKLGKGLAGQLGAISVAEIVQTLHANQKTGLLHLTRDAERGEIYVAEGETKYARTGALAGENAFYALLAWNRGSFAFKIGPRDLVSEGMPGTMSLLMEGMRRLDESRV